MIATVLIVTFAIFLTFCIYLMGALRFLAQYRDLLWHDYGLAILAYATALFVNVFALVFWLQRRFFMKDTGQKLAHFKKQIRMGESQLSQELAEKLGGGN